MKIINLTPHDVVIFKNGVEMIRYISMGVARIDISRVIVDNVNGINIYKNCYGKVSGLPDESKDVFYIVSRIVAEAFPLRNDLLLTNDSVRNSCGEIIGCNSLAKL